MEGDGMSTNQITEPSWKTRGDEGRDWPDMNMDTAHDQAIDAVREDGEKILKSLTALRRRYLNEMGERGYEYVSTDDDAIVDAIRALWREFGDVKKNTNKETTQ
jgi:hypothetical protein